MVAKTVEEIINGAEKVEVEPSLDRLIDSFLTGISTAYNRNPNLQQRMPFRIAVAALFDLCVNALYARTALSSGWLYCSDKHAEVRDEHFAGDYLYYPFVAACPRCAMKGDFYRADAQKPPSGSIGDLNAVVIAALYDRVAQSSPGGARVFRIPGTGDADLIFLEGDDVCVAEIKASPLVSYPLAITSNVIEDYDPKTGQRRTLDHSQATATHLSNDSIYLYLSHINRYVDLGANTQIDWPMKALSQYVSAPEGAQEIALAWFQLFSIQHTRGNPRRTVRHRSSECRVDKRRS